jgi:hypothetical protein
MARSQLSRAIENLEREIAILQTALSKLKAEQKASPVSRRKLKAPSVVEMDRKTASSGS